MPPSRLDMLYRRMLITRFFEKGWGKPENLQKLFEFRKEVSNRQRCYKLVPPDYHVEITHEEKCSDYHIVEGKFLTPLELYLPGLVPEAARYAHFQMLLPLRWPHQNHRPMCVHFAGTGDHYYWRRRNFIAKPLLRDAGVGAILLENPFYGVRKPCDQVRSNLNNVSDIFVMGGCLVLENLVLLHWLERQGLGPLGVTGLSMGGHNASLAATNWPKPLVLVPCLSWSTAAPVFTQGVMSQSINWDTLETQYFADGQYRERLAKMVTIVDDTFRAGQHFAKHFTESMQELRSDMQRSVRQETTAAAATAADACPTMPLPSKLPFDVHALGLSPALLQKIHTGARIGLTADESAELQTKIALARGRMSATGATTPTPTDTAAILTTTNGGGMADTIGSYISSGTTQLMNFIQPTSTTTTTTAAADSDDLTAGFPKTCSIDTTRDKWWEREALQFMRGVMDECTHLKNFSVPYDTSLITAIVAKDDAYVPRDGCTGLEEIWPGAEVKYVDAGHVSAYVLHQKLFRSCIVENFERARHKYGSGAEDGSQRVVAEPLVDAPPATETYDELYTRYVERDRSGERSDVQQ